ncbi:MAG: hypothetical protein H7Y38_08825 [Armatimonadetes bacterium]|nr:hypothetical protein [Armatimonadota bacterium]
MTVKNITIGLLVLGNLFAAANIAQAQILVPDPTLSINFRTDGTGTLANLQQTAFGVGYDAANFQSSFSAAPTVATAQSGYNPFRIDTSIVAGSTFSIGVHAYAINRAASTTPVTIYASIYEFNASAPAGTVPLGNSILTDLPVVITPSQSTLLTDAVYYTPTVTLPQGLNADATYIIGFGPSATAGVADPANFAFVYRRVFSQTVDTVAANTGPDEQYPETAEFATFRTIYQTNNNSATDGGAFSALETATTATSIDNPANPFAYQLLAAAPVVVPEAGSTALVLAGAGILGLVIRKQSRQFTKG